MLRFAWIVIVVACGGKKDEPPKSDPPPKATPDAAVVKVEPDASNERPPDDKPPPLPVKVVEGDCNPKNADVALVGACEYRCREKKEAEACAIGASKLYKGEGIRADPKKGGELVRLACELESADGCVYLARLDTAKADELGAKALTLFERDCEAGLALSCLALVDRVKGTDEAAAKAAYKKGLDLASKGCDSGDGTLCFAASVVLDTGGLEIDKDVRGAAELRKQACERNHAPTCLRLSTETDKEEKRGPLLEKACTLGLLKACGQLALELAAKNTTKAAKAIERACQLGDGEWCVRIGEDFAKANEKDKAIEMFVKACKLGNEGGCSQARQLGAK